MKEQEDWEGEAFSSQRKSKSKSRGSSKRSREVNEQEAEEYLKRPTKKMSDLNRDLKKVYDKEKHLKDSKFDYIRELKQRRKKGEDSISEHGGTDDEDYHLGDDLKKGRKKKMDLSSESDQPRRINKTKRGKKGGKMGISLEPRETSKSENKKDNSSIDMIEKKEEKKEVSSFLQEKPTPVKPVVKQKSSESSSSSSQSQSSSEKSKNSDQEAQNSKKQNKKEEKQEVVNITPFADQQKNEKSQILEVVEPVKGSLESESQKENLQKDVKETPQSDQVNQRLQSQQIQSKPESEKEEEFVSRNRQKMDEEIKQSAIVKDADKMDEEKNKDEIMKKGEAQKGSDISVKGSQQSQSDSKQKSDSGSGRDNASKSPTQQIELVDRIKDVLKGKKEQSSQQVQLATFTKRGTRKKRRQPPKKSKPIAKKTKSAQKKQKFATRTVAITKIQSTKQKRKQNIEKFEQNTKQLPKMRVAGRRRQIKQAKAQESITIIEPVKTRAKAAPKTQQTVKKPIEQKKPVQKVSNRRSRKQRQTQLNLRGQIADMQQAEKLISESVQPQKQKDKQEQPLVIEEGQQFISSYIKKRESAAEEPQKLNANISAQNSPVEASFKQQEKSEIIINQEQEVVRAGWRTILPIVPPEDKRKKLTLNSRVIVESILYFDSKREPEIVQMIKPRKPKRKVVVMASDQEEPVQYVYKRKSRPPERQAVRKYRKVVVEESDLQDDDGYYTYYQPSYRKIRKIRYENEEEDPSWRRQKKRSKHSYSVTKQEQPEYQEKKSEKILQSEDDTRQAEMRIPNIEVIYTGGDLK